MKTTNYRVAEKGALVLRRGKNFADAAAEFAKNSNSKDHKVTFSCPNYAVVLLDGKREATIWAN